MVMQISRQICVRPLPLLLAATAWPPPGRAVRGCDGIRMLSSSTMPAREDGEAFEAYGLRVRELQREARLQAARDSLQQAASIDQRAEDRYGETYTMKSFYEGLQQAGKDEEGEVALVDAASLPEREAEALVPQVTAVANWAYRGKHAGGDEGAWTGERHLIAGIRTTETAVRSMIQSARERGPTEEALLLATLRGESPARVVGTVQATRGAAARSDEAEIGFFSVDPDLQSEGIGGALLSRAERHAKQQMGVTTAVLNVLSLRADLIGWYQRRG